MYLNKYIIWLVTSIAYCKITTLLVYLLSEKREDLDSLPEPTRQKQ